MRIRSYCAFERERGCSFSSSRERGITAFYCIAAPPVSNYDTTSGCGGDQLGSALEWRPLRHIILYDRQKDQIFDDRLTSFPHLNLDQNASLRGASPGNDVSARSVIVSKFKIFTDLWCAKELQRAPIFHVFLRRGQSASVHFLHERYDRNSKSRYHPTPLSSDIPSPITIVSYYSSITINIIIII